MDRLRQCTHVGLDAYPAPLAPLTHLDRRPPRLGPTWRSSGATPSGAWRDWSCRGPPSERVSAGGHASALCVCPGLPLTLAIRSECSEKPARGADRSLRRAMALQRARGGGVQVRLPPTAHPQFCSLRCGSLRTARQAVQGANAEPQQCPAANMHAHMLDQPVAVPSALPMAAGGMGRPSPLLHLAITCAALPCCSGPSSPSPKRVTLRTLRDKYMRGEPISMVTAYDYPSAVHVRTC